ncbi:unnamed protein product, partial [Oppiella nova]
IYDLLVNNLETGEALYGVEVDLIPWGSAERTRDTTGAQVFDYACAENDVDCKATRLHACIARNHVTNYVNHHEFRIAVCTVGKSDWKQNPLANAIACSNANPDIIDDGVTFVLCANSRELSDPYLNQVIAATDTLHPVFDYSEYLL